MDPRFMKNIPALRPEEQARLTASRVFVAGCGGLGGYVLELLLRLGVGRITAADGDCFDLSDRNRQLLSLESNVGVSKVRVAAARARDVAPAVEFRAVETWLTRENLPELLQDCDLVIDALDSVDARLALEDACAEAGLSLIHGAVYGWLAQAAVVPPGSGLLRRLYAGGVPAREATVLAPTAAFCAAVQCAQAAKLLAGRPADLSGRLFTADLEQGELQTIELA